MKCTDYAPTQPVWGMYRPGVESLYGVRWVWGRQGVTMHAILWRGWLAGRAYMPLVLRVPVSVYNRQRPPVQGGPKNRTLYSCPYLC